MEEGQALDSGETLAELQWGHGEVAVEDYERIQAAADHEGLQWGHGRGIGLMIPARGLQVNPGQSHSIRLDP